MTGDGRSVPPGNARHRPRRPHDGPVPVQLPEPGGYAIVLSDDGRTMTRNRPAAHSTYRIPSYARSQPTSRPELYEFILVILEGAILIRASCIRADLTKANLTEANLADAKLINRPAPPPSQAGS
jgi:hypothetical protein